MTCSSIVTSQETLRTLVDGEISLICLETESRSDVVRATIMTADAPAWAYERAVEAPNPLPAPAIRTVNEGWSLTSVGSIEGTILVCKVAVKLLPQCLGQTAGGPRTILEVNESFGFSGLEKMENARMFAEGKD